jgi:hypothetical protein
MYQPGIPTGLVNLDVDYQNIQDNFQQLDTTFAVDHYAYSDPSSSNGFHNKVTTPGFSTGSAPVTGLFPVFYGFQQYSAIGLIQYSRGINNALPTPLTTLNGGPISLATTATTNIIDFAGMTRVMCILSAFNDTNTSTKNPVNAFIAFSQNTFNVTTGTAGNLAAASSGTILQLKNNTPGTLGAVYWNLQFLRIE